ncbi:endo-1,4-beta-xylanase [Isoptericola sp. NPDC056578]|uniref:endo-1,4-beta-xylanase n=1 Tax=Isoptericola sp. NPDC056578 TaxID=3345870 RepID=UPI00367D2367
MRQRVRRAVAGTAAAAVMASGAVVTGVVGASMAAGDDSVVLENDFDTSYDPWGPRGAVTLEISDDARTGAGALSVTGRTAEWNGPATAVGGLFAAGGDYDVEAWVKLPAGTAGSAAVHFTVQETSAGGDAYTWVGGAVDATADGWVRVGGTYTMPADLTAAQLYVEAAPVGGAHPSFLVDDLVVTGGERTSPPVQDLTGVKETVDFPVGVAIDQRETTGDASELLLRHFDQITAENHMKPEAWYADDRTFRPDPQAVALMDYAAEHDLRVYGHVLVWHSQTPEWFFQAEDGTPLTTSDADRAVLRERLRTHVFSVAGWLAERYGQFGGDNPLTAFDVVNEVVNDGATSDPDDGLRRSEWYRILGEDFIDLAFGYADEAFNHTYAAEGADRPVALFINDYNTEQSGKQDRYLALVERLLARGVPVDGVGHQFHVSLSMPVGQLEAAVERFADLPVTQAVTELDVTTGTPETQANLVEQGYWYRDAFRMFREHAQDLYSVTVWGLTDDRSWRADSGGPLLFDRDRQAKPAYVGAVDGDVPPRLKAARVFAGDVPLDADAASSAVWDRLPRHIVTADGSGEVVADFQLRWAPDHLTAQVRVTDGTVGTGGDDAVTFDVDGATTTVGRDGTVTGPDGAAAVVEAVDGGYVVVAHLPLAGAAQGDTAGLDVQVADGATTSGWNTPGSLGTLTLLEELSYLEVAEATTPPQVDGTVDEAWADASAVTTDRQIEGEGGATATVRTLWSGDTLYVLAEVADPTVDVSGSDPWVQDSVEIFLDAGNAKNGSYRDVDTQIRISAENVTSFGTGDEAAQAARLTSATATVDGGYVVEAAVDLLGTGGAGTFHGLDFQVNDGTAGARTAVRDWADPTGTGYQSTARWGVGRLVAAVQPEPEGLVNVAAPAVVTDDRKGTAPGAVLVAEPGEWTAPDGERVRYTYRWLRDGEPVRRPLGALTDLARLLDLTGQVLRGTAEPEVLLSVAGSTYRVGGADVGHEVSVEVTAHARGLDDVTAVSAPVTAARR